MKNVLASICFSFLFGFLSGNVSGQSTYVSIHSKARSTARRPVFSGTMSTRDSVRNSVSIQMRGWESILARSYPDRFLGTLTTQSLVKELNELQLPVILHQSALDDLLSSDDPIELKLPNASLHARLRLALEEFNACLFFGLEEILIISIDDADNADFLSQITYDVTGMGIGIINMIDTIQNTIASDSWEDTGTGWGTIQYVSVRGKDLLVVTQTYKTHVQIRNMFNDISGMTGLRNVRNSQPQYASPIGRGLRRGFSRSHPAQMFPTATRSANQQPPHSSGGGIGGFGG